MSGLTDNASEAGYLIGHGTEHIIGGLREYLLKHFAALRDPYLDAAKRHLLVVLWWD